MHKSEPKQAVAKNDFSEHVIISNISRVSLNFELEINKMLIIDGAMSIFMGGYDDMLMIF